MRSLPVWAVVGTLALLGWGNAQAFDTGSVHQEHCAACHARVTGGDGHLLYRGTEGLVANTEQLQARVDHCRKGARLDWPEAHVEAMSKYLNERHYRFKTED